MTDIFAHWKKRRFVVVDYDLLDNGSQSLVILTDITYWALNHEKLDQWCEQHNAVATGMTVTIPDEKTLTAFCLRWN